MKKVLNQEEKDEQLGTLLDLTIRNDKIIVLDIDFINLIGTAIWQGIS